MTTETRPLEMRLYLCSHCGIEGWAPSPTPCPKCGLKKFVHYAETGRFAFPRAVREKENNPDVGEADHGA